MSLPTCPSTTLPSPGFQRSITFEVEAILSNDLRVNQLNADFKDFVKELKNSTPLGTLDYTLSHHFLCRSQRQRGLRRGSAAARLLGLWDRIPQGAWMFVSCECCVITRPEESYRLWCVVVCDLETSSMRRPWPTGGCCPKKQTTTTLLVNCPHI